MTTSRSHVPFVNASGEPIAALDEATLSVTSEGLAWPGIHVESGYADRWEVHEVSVTEHYVALNTDDVPLHFDVLDRAASHEVVMPPGSVWFCPAGASFSHRVEQPSSFVVVTLAPDRLARAFGGDAPRSLVRSYAVVNPTLEHLMRAFVAEAQRGGPGGAPFADVLATATAVQLAQTFGRPEPTSRMRGGLAPAALRRAVERIRADLADGVSVEVLAREACLSPAHFARAFKQSTGYAPHRYLIEARLEVGAARARPSRRPDRRRGADGRVRRPGALHARVQEALRHHTRRRPPCAETLNTLDHVGWIRHNRSCPIPWTRTAACCCCTVPAPRRRAVSARG